MPDDTPQRPDPDKEDIMAGDRRISRPDSRMPDWYIPDASYRPIPIAWFTAAVLIQSVAMFAIFTLLFKKSGWLTIGLAGLASIALYLWSMDRGLKEASMGWKMALAIVLALQFLLVANGVSPRL
ncbi:MAG: hypothetical protein AAGL68_05985 [Pseudomonadota bacterium]